MALKSEHPTPPKTTPGVGVAGGGGEGTLEIQLV